MRVEKKNDVLRIFVCVYLEHIESLRRYVCVCCTAVLFDALLSSHYGIRLNCRVIHWWEENILTWSPSPPSPSAPSLHPRHNLQWYSCICATRRYTKINLVPHFLGVTKPYVYDFGDWNNNMFRSNRLEAEDPGLNNTYFIFSCPSLFTNRNKTFNLSHF